MIELLVAMAITSIIMMALLSLIGQTTGSYTETQRAVNALSEARAFVQFFSRELATQLPASPLIYEKGGSGSGSASSDKVAFIRAVPLDEQSENDPGDLNTSIYYVAFTADPNNSQSPKLFRKTMGPSDTHELLKFQSPPPFPSTDPAEDEPIIHHVLSFQAIPMQRDSNGGLREWTSSSGEPPDVIELSIRFIDDSSAQRFRTKGDWGRLATAPDNHELQLIRSYTRLIPIGR